jgi:hypothetical protein
VNMATPFHTAKVDSQLSPPTQHQRRTEGFLTTDVSLQPYSSYQYTALKWEVSSLSHKLFNLICFPPRSLQDVHVTERYVEVGV